MKKSNVLKTLVVIALSLQITPVLWARAGGIGSAATPSGFSYTKPVIIRPIPQTATPRMRQNYAHVMNIDTLYRHWYGSSLYNPNHPRWSVVDQKHILHNAIVATISWSLISIRLVSYYSSYSLMLIGLICAYCAPALFVQVLGMYDDIPGILTVLRGASLLSYALVAVTTLALYYFSRQHGLLTSKARCASVEEKASLTTAYIAIQNAISQRDISLSVDYISASLREAHQKTIDRHIKDGVVNYIDNICVRSVHVLRACHRTNRMWFQVCAEMRDYICDPSSGSILSGTQALQQIRDILTVRRLEGRYVIEDIENQQAT